MLGDTCTLPPPTPLHVTGSAPLRTDLRLRPVSQTSPPRTTSGGGVNHNNFTHSFVVIETLSYFMSRTGPLTPTHGAYLQVHAV